MLLKELAALPEQISSMEEEIELLQQTYGKSMTEGNPDYFILNTEPITRWNNKTDEIWVQIKNGSSLKYWNDNNITLVKEAFLEWQEGINNKIKFIFVDDKSPYDVQVTWLESTFIQDNMDAGGGNSYDDDGKVMLKNDICLSLVDPDSIPFPANVLRTIALHEIGHVLGIRWHSDEAHDVMFYAKSNSVFNEARHLTSRDINTFFVTYKHKPDITNPVGKHLSEIKPLLDWEIGPSDPFEF